MPRRYHQNRDLLGACQDRVEEKHLKQNTLAFKSTEVGGDFCILWEAEGGCCGWSPVCAGEKGAGLGEV